MLADDPSGRYKISRSAIDLIETSRDFGLVSAHDNDQTLEQWVDVAEVGDTFITYNEDGIKMKFERSK